MKPIKLKNVFAITKDQMLPLNARLTARAQFRPIEPKQKGHLPKQILKINKES